MKADIVCIYELGRLWCPQSATNSTTPVIHKSYPSTARNRLYQHVLWKFAAGFIMHYVSNSQSVVCSMRHAAPPFSRLSWTNRRHHLGGHPLLTNNEFRATRSATDLHSSASREFRGRVARFGRFYSAILRFMFICLCPRLLRFRLQFPLCTCGAAIDLLDNSVDRNRKQIGNRRT